MAAKISVRDVAPPRKIIISTLRTRERGEGTDIVWKGTAIETKKNWGKKQHQRYQILTLKIAQICKTRLEFREIAR